MPAALVIAASNRYGDASGAILINANFAGANLACGCPGYTMSFTGVDLSGAYLSGLDFSTSNLTDTNLTGANLSDSNLSGCVGAANCPSGAGLVGANFTGTDFLGARFSRGGGGVTLGNNTWSNTTCPDGTNGDSDGSACINNGA